MASLVACFLTYFSCMAAGKVSGVSGRYLQTGDKFFTSFFDTCRWRTGINDTDEKKMDFWNCSIYQLISHWYILISEFADKSLKFNLMKHFRVISTDSPAWIVTFSGTLRFFADPLINDLAGIWPVGKPAEVLTRIVFVSYDKCAQSQRWAGRRPCITFCPPI